MDSMTLNVAETSIYFIKAIIDGGRIFVNILINKLNRANQFYVVIDNTNIALFYVISVFFYESNLTNNETKKRS